MSVRSVNVSYSIRESTSLPGFKPNLFLFGFDSSFNAPGIEFLLGSQSRNILTRSVNNDWLVRNEELTTPFQQTQTQDINIRADLEPVRDLKIQLTAKKQSGSNYQEIFRFDSLNNDFRTFAPSRNGTYSLSIVSIGTSFIRDRDDNSSEVFEEFVSNRNVIRERITQQTGVESNDLNRTDILIPAFLAAYTNQPVEEIALTPFKKIPIPNWRVDYSGLTRFGNLSEIFSSITLSHAYTSTYSLGNFSSNFVNLDSTDFGVLANEIDLSNNYADYPLQSILIQDPTTGMDSLAPLFTFQQVNIREQFGPLIGINVATKTRVRGRVEYKRERNLTLTLNSGILTELRRSDLSFELGYTKANFKIPFRIQGRTVRLKNDLTVDVRFTVSDTETLQRRIETNPDQENNLITQGNRNFQIRPQISYVISNRLNLQFYFERTVNEPKVTTSFKRSTTAFGFQFRFSLSD
jgi:cell surface protein SprA